MWNGRCEVVADRECAHVAIRRRLTSQGRSAAPMVPAKDYSAKLKPGSADLRKGRGAPGAGGDR
jgi:hypothetical protein